MKATRPAAIAVGVAVVLTGAAISAAPAAAEPTSPADFGDPSAQQVGDSIQVWDPTGFVQVWDPTGFVTPLETTSFEGDQTVLRLDSDILFEFGSAELPTSAAATIADLVADIPPGARVSVTGHTDDVGTDADNLRLSVQRAETVAAAVATARRDLVLDVEGSGEGDPIESNNTPEGREVNRRVEIRFGG